MARQPFNTRWAQGVESESSLNTFQAPSDVRVSTGWEGGQDKDAPPAGQENWWHNRVDSALQGVERNGVMSWHPLAVYGLGAPSYGPDGNYYESLAELNQGNDPSTSTGFWLYHGPSFFSGNRPGDVKMVAHNNIPAIGWLKCNGAVLSRASYQLLFAEIGTAHNIGGETNLQFRLPDCRGEFIRGFDDGRGVDLGRVFGSAQGDMNKSHTHEVVGTGAYDGINITVGITSSNPDPLQINLGDKVESSGRSSDMRAETSGGVESRPRNKVFNYWIKY